MAFGLLDDWEKANTVRLPDAPPPFPLRILAIVFAELVRRWDSPAPVWVLLGNNNICLVQDL